MKYLQMHKNEGQILASSWECAFLHMAAETPGWVRTRLAQIYAKWPEIRPKRSILDTPAAKVKPIGLIR